MNRHAKKSIDVAMLEALARSIKEREIVEEYRRNMFDPPKVGAVLSGRRFGYYEAVEGEQVQLLPTDWVFMCTHCGMGRRHAVILAFGSKMSEEERDECLVALGWRLTTSVTFACSRAPRVSIES